MRGLVARLQGYQMSGLRPAFASPCCPACFGFCITACTALARLDQTQVSVSVLRRIIPIIASDPITVTSLDRIELMIRQNAVYPGERLDMAFALRVLKLDYTDEVHASARWCK